MIQFNLKHKFNLVLLHMQKIERHLLKK